MKIDRDGKVDDYDEVYINLDATDDDEIVIINKEDFDQTALIRLTDLLYGPLSVLFGFSEKYTQLIVKIPTTMKFLLKRKKRNFYRFQTKFLHL